MTEIDIEQFELLGETTEGEWTVKVQRGMFVISAETKDSFNVVASEINSLHDARIMARAPDLLKEVKRLRELVKAHTKFKYDFESLFD